MERKKYTITCPHCNKKYEMWIDDRMMKAFQLLAEHNGGLECSRCGKTIPLIRRNMRRAFKL